MKQILIINRRYCPGEAWTNRILAYAKGLAKNGCDVSLVYLITDKNRTSYTINVPGVKVINLWENDRYLAKKIRPLALLINLLKARKLVTKDVDIFIYGIAWYIIKAFISIKIRGTVGVEVTENPYFRKLNRLESLEMKLNLRLILKADNLFVISKQLKEYFINLGYAEKRVHILNMFVDTDRFKNVLKDIEDKYIGYCGAVSYEKDGVNILIKAFSIFHQTHPEYKLYIIGKGTSPEVIPSLKELARKENVEECTKFTGYVSPEQMPSLLANASILALARPNSVQAQHGFPTKLGEYLATGNPVVVTRVGSIPDFIVHQKNGYLVNPNDPYDFAEKLSWVADNPEESKTVGINGSKLAYNEFSYLSQSKYLKEFFENGHK